MSTLTARRAVARALPTALHNDSLSLLKRALVNAATEPDSGESRATLRALCAASLFLIDAAEKRVR